MSYIGGNELILNQGANGEIQGGGFSINSIADCLGITTFNNNVQSGGSLSSVGDLFKGNLVVPCGLLYQRGPVNNIYDTMYLKKTVDMEDYESDESDEENEIIGASIYDKLLELANPNQTLVKKNKKTRRRLINKTNSINSTNKRFTKRR
jgi:hypothetical protein